MQATRNKKRNKKQKPGQDSRGSSLIEVIVAMLLLGIIVVPMLEMFSAAARINGKAREAQNANLVLENFVEELTAHNINYQYEIANPLEQDLRDGFEKMILYSELSENASLSDDLFYSASIRQGSSEYQLRMQLSEDEYFDSGVGLNDYQMPQINPFHEETTEALQLDTTADETMTNWFYERYLDVGELEYQNRYQAAYLASEEYQFYYNRSAWTDWWWETHAIEPPEGYTPPSFDSSTVASFSPLSIEEFSLYIRKNTSLSVDKQEDDTYAVNGLVHYEMAEVEPHVLNLEGSFTESMEYTIGSGVTFEADKLQNIYLFYPPFTPDMTQEDLQIDLKEISKEDAFSCCLFLAIQEEALSPLNFDVKLIMDETLSTTQMEEKCKLFTPGGVKTVFAHETKLVNHLPATPMVYRATIEILRAGTDRVVASTELTLTRP